MNLERLYSVILGPHVSEKTTILGELNNQYTFKVARDASKPEIKAAVEDLFKVSVTAVNTLIAKGKTKKFRGRAGKRIDTKKAIITLAEGQSIDISTGV